jgi:hypothetical protein
VSGHRVLTEVRASFGARARRRGHALAPLVTHEPLPGLLGVEVVRRLSDTVHRGLQPGGISDPRLVQRRGETEAERHGEDLGVVARFALSLARRTPKLQDSDRSLRSQLAS